MKGKIKQGGHILIFTILAVLIFSGIILIKISKLNFSIYNKCEQREYVEWTKSVLLNQERQIELMEERNEATDKIELDRQAGSMFRNPFLVERINEIDLMLQSGYEAVSDEERRAKSRQEAEDYKNCLNEQEIAIKKRPEEYSFLFIGDSLILLTGLTLVYALKRK